jgi:hypothetical protein
LNAARAPQLKASVMRLFMAPVKYMIRILILLLLLACWTPVAGQRERPFPQVTADRFYRTYLKLKVRGLPNEKELKALSPFLSRDLQQLFKDARSTQQKYIREHPDDKPPWDDGDLFTSLFEGANSFRLGVSRIKGARAEVPVHLAYRGGGSISRWSDVLVLTRTGDGWRVWDILLKGEWAFKSGESLRGVLSSD